MAIFKIIGPFFNILLPVDASGNRVIHKDEGKCEKLFFIKYITRIYNRS